MESNKINSNNSESDYLIGQRSITHKGFKSRFDLLRDKKNQNKQSRPFLYLGFIIILIIVIIPVYSFYSTYIKPPTEIALRVNDKEYTRGDVVDYIRFNQRITEDLGSQFEIGTSLFDALQTLQDNEIAYQLAPRYGITVESTEVDEHIENMLGYFFEKTMNIDQEEQKNFEESKRQFLNKIGLSEEIYRDFIKKTIFKERLRTVVAETIPRVQSQVHIYQITLRNPDDNLIRKINRDLDAGKPITDITSLYSEDPNIKRNNGEVGWFPYGVVTDLDYLFFGLDSNGDRILPVRELSPIQYDQEDQSYILYIVEEVSEAREISNSNLESLIDRALVIFLNKERKKIAAEGDLYMDLNDKIYGWVNKQVQLSSLLPTPNITEGDNNMISADQIR
ncbi:MAG: hypothetical protein CL778_02875 [Chloroflexi bacterium]|nr:hypothetical protein [Chloroflexota bacterium]|tara:strand:- start:43569 stop:44747 length:1179 start_codon:yes stop_codon:yes gene_type:complete